jgi:gliding motility-associated-like protein
MSGTLIMILGSGFVAEAQYFENPSFEGVPGVGLSPPSWSPLDANSTPDTEPLTCDNFTASDGETYLTLVTRGADHPFPFSNEAIITSLVQPLSEDKYYRLSIDLASRDDVGHFTWEDGFTAYNYPVKLNIYSSEDGLVKHEFLAESEAVTNQSWGTFSFILDVMKPAAYLIFEVTPANAQEAPGNILLDHIRIVELDEPPIEFGDLFVPNVFTPNGDGSNDLFLIRGLARGSSLLVFDRTGKEVYRSTNYEQNWDGRNMGGQMLPPGTYWYVLFPSDQTEVLKGFIYLKIEE